MDYFLKNPILGLGWTNWRRRFAGRPVVALMTLLQRRTIPCSDAQRIRSGRNDPVYRTLLACRLGTLAWCAFGRKLVRYLNVGAFAAFSGMLLSTMTSVTSLSDTFGFRPPLLPRLS